MSNWWMCFNEVVSGSSVVCSLALQTAINGKNYWRAQSPDDQPSSSLPLGRVWTQHSPRGSTSWFEAVWSHHQGGHIWPVHTAPEHLLPHLHAWLNLLSSHCAAAVNYPVPAWLLKFAKWGDFIQLDVSKASLLKIFAQMRLSMCTQHIYDTV